MPKRVLPAPEAEARKQKWPRRRLQSRSSSKLFGRTITLDDVGLPAFTVAMGLLDGFNPCSMWVLLLMISLLAPLNDRRRMLAIAGTFVLVEGIAYFLFMAAWLNLFLLIGLSRASQLIIAAIAIVAGLINVKDFFALQVGVSLSIPEKAKPGIYSRMRGILHAESLGGGDRRRDRAGHAGADRRVPLHVGLPGAVHAHPDAARTRHRELLRLPAALHRRLHARRRHHPDDRRCHAAAATACRKGKGGCSS